MAYKVYLALFEGMHITCQFANKSFKLRSSDLLLVLKVCDGDEFQLLPQQTLPEYL